MDTLSRYTQYEQAQALEQRRPLEARNNEAALHEMAFLRTIEHGFMPASVSESEAALGYAGKEEAVLAIGRDMGVHAPTEVRVAVLHGNDTSDLMAVPSWSESTPDHLRTGWQLNSRELRTAREMLASDETDTETATLLRKVVDEQTDAMSQLAVAAVTGGAVLASPARS